MNEPQLVKECVSVMAAASPLPVTVKTRIGVDDRTATRNSRISSARWRRRLQALHHPRPQGVAEGSFPKENRENPAPALRRGGEPQARFSRAHRRGETAAVQTLEAMESHLGAFDGVMVGREAVSNPYLFADVDRRFFDPKSPVLSRAEILCSWMPYLAAQLQEGVPLARMTRHALGLFHGCPGARQWRRHLSEAGTRPGADLGVLHEALASLKLAA